MFFFLENCQKVERMNLYLKRELEKVQRQLEDLTNLQIVGKEEQEIMNEKAVEMEIQVERNKGGCLFD